jgi:5-amino-6-(5-phosphoribosylamino)uracil reductase
MSLDGHIDDTGPDRLVLSGPADLDRVDEERANSDAILVGAETVRRDNPRLLIRSPVRQHRRLTTGLPAHPAKVTLTASGRLDPYSAFFTAGESQRLVYAASAAVPLLADLPATVVDAGPQPQLPWLLDHLAARGVKRLLVEGGSGLHTAFLTAGLADELQLVVAPLFVGEAAAPRFVGAGRFPGGRLRLVDTRALDDVVLLRYLTGDRDG